MENYQKDLQSHSRQLPLGTMSSSCVAAPATAMPVPSVAEQVRHAIYRIDECQNKISVDRQDVWNQLNSIKNQLASVAHALGMKEL